MKRSTFASFSAAGALIVALAPGVSHAQWDGQVKFVGKVSEVTCLINGKAPGMDNILEVPLKEHKPGFFTAIGTTTAPVEFQIRLTDTIGGECTTGKHAKLAFDNDAPSVDKATGNLKITSTSPATGVQIQISDAGNNKGDKIFLGTAQVDPQSVQLSAAGGTLTYSARYIATESSVSAGTANSIIPFMVAYD
ncbi:fimbrial protein [Achromobacter pestifer]